MALFTGEYDCKLDAKGRLTLPSKIKSRLPEGSGNLLVLNMVINEPCLELYPMVEYRKIYAKVASLNALDEESRQLQRSIFRRMSEVELDSAGRLLVPRNMLVYAGLEREITLVGMGNRLELWNSETYMKYILKDGEDFSKLVDKHLNQ
jgi:MraZ protein